MDVGKEVMSCWCHKVERASGLPPRTIIPMVENDAVNDRKRLKNVDLLPFFCRFIVISDRLRAVLFDLGSFAQNFYLVVNKEHVISTFVL